MFIKRVIKIKFLFMKYLGDCIKQLPYNLKHINLDLRSNNLGEDSENM